eukprot:CAMPEP_0175997654 /NCGR_PEP_ID=MMETSP0108-20121206/56304_1 /TAXON_ID=195067 ORGANISM="Goniomonas pacifica, Strain CCMP1869" /NCGR_SAMPLE_ID=MMETSP0108 /ASSEMBLY_ACC=CAM_ASM_000204 /LENGTH=80 /DNA_ID=CAMNT_0017329905 /DNA_START=380 /DNA_END=625 /DNA_ORIENTATION=+
MAHPDDAQNVHSSNPTLVANLGVLAASSVRDDPGGMRRVAWSRMACHVSGKPRKTVGLTRTRDSTSVELASIPVAAGPKT